MAKCLWLCSHCLSQRLVKMPLTQWLRLLLCLHLKLLLLLHQLLKRQSRQRKLRHLLLRRQLLQRRQSTFRIVSARQHSLQLPAPAIRSHCLKSGPATLMGVA